MQAQDLTITQAEEESNITNTNKEREQQQEKGEGLDRTIQQSLEAFLDSLALNRAALAESQQAITAQLTALAGDAQNLAAAADIPAEKLAIINEKVERIPHLQSRVDASAKKLLQAHKAITYLRGELQSLLK